MRQSFYTLALFLLAAGGVLMLWGKAAGGAGDDALSWDGQRITLDSTGLTWQPTSSDGTPSLPTIEELTGVTTIQATLSLADLAVATGEEFQILGGAGVSCTVDGDILTITDNGSLSGQLTLVLPWEMALDTLEIYSEMGDVSLSDITVHTLRVETSLGDIQLSGHPTGDVAIQTSSGDVLVESGLSGYEYTGLARSQHGRVTVDGNDVGSGARLTGNGPNNMDIYTLTGNITLEFSLN